MQHYKTYWRYVIVDRLTGNTLAGDNVFTNHVTPQSLIDIWINVTTSEESIGAEPHELSLSQVTMREQRYKIDVIVRDNATPEDTAEYICAQIEQLIFDDEFLISSACGVDYDGSNQEKSTELEKTTVIYSMFFLVRGATPRKNPFYMV
jgi:hypothetical protein